MSKAGVLAMIGYVVLAGCGNSTSPDVPSRAGPPVAGAVTWTTLGTRALPSEPGSSITTNAGATWSDYDPPALYPNIARLPTQFIPLANGEQLAAYVAVPADGNGTAVAGAFPTILLQTGYTGGSGTDTSTYLVQHGYAFVVVDVLGAGESTGAWEAWGPNEQAGYAQTVEWITRQPWCNGNLGLAGTSYDAIVQLLTAAQGNPAIKAAFPVVPGGDMYRDMVFTGGQASMLFMPVWLTAVTANSAMQLDLASNPDVAARALGDHIRNALLGFQVPFLAGEASGDPDLAYDNPARDSFWGARSTLEGDHLIRAAVFIVGGTHDLFQRSEPVSYERIKTHAPVKLLMGPWAHLQAGSGLPLDGVPTLDHVQLRWFDHYVKGMDVGADRLPNVTQFVSGYGHYVTSTDWPHPRVRARRLYLHGDGSLSSDPPATGEPPHQVLQEPANGICSISLSQWTAGAAGYLPVPCLADDTVAEIPDVKYESAPLAEDMYINGPIEADVWMSTTAGDAGLSVRVDDVDESGNALALTNGIQTASLRAVDASRSRFMDGRMIQPWHPFSQASVQPVGSDAVRVPVEIFETSALIAKGHRLRVAVGASDLPQGVPPLPTLLQMPAGVLTIHSDADHPSSVVIPLVPVAALH